jgi:hypothetical protein
MYVIALIGDLLGPIPIVNWISTPIAIIALSIAASHKGVSLYSSKRIAGTLAMMIVEVIPFVRIVPTLLIRVYFVNKDVQESEA